jgi:hypothetical protein
MTSETITINRARAASSPRPMGGLKAQAIAQGAHPACMAAGRAGSCDGCLSIVDHIIDSKHTRQAR